MIRFGTYNLLNLYDSRQNRDRHERVLQVIRDLQVDILAVQEIRGDPNMLAEAAAAVGMTAHYEPPRYDEEDASAGKLAVGASPNGFHVGLMWREETVRPVPDSFRVYEHGFFHSLVVGLFEVEGREVRHAACHMNPFGNIGGQRAGECERLVSAMTRVAQHDERRPPRRPPGLVGSDWNLICADRTVTGEYYDPDPYAGRPWHGSMVYQCEWDYDERGRRTNWRANRAPGDVLYAGGLYDAVVARHNATIDTGGVPWHHTAGHWRDLDPFGSRRIDGIRVTEDVRAAIRDVEVIDTALTRSASDHLPVVVTYDPAAIGSPAAMSRAELAPRMHRDEDQDVGHPALSHRTG